MTVHKRSMLVAFARREIQKRPNEVDVIPERYEPPEWLLAALEAAYDAGSADRGAIERGTAGAT